MTLRCLLFGRFVADVPACDRLGNHAVPNFELFPHGS